MRKGCVSIIVPVYKVEPYLRTCIDSVLSQSYSNWELILVDDGSPDTCPKTCDEYAKQDERIIVLHKDNGGLSSARNKALDLPPKGEFISFLDSDDFWHNKYLEEMIILQSRYNADMVQCSFIRGTDTSFPNIDISPVEGVFDNHEVFLKEKANVIMCGKLFRADLFDDLRMPVGLYNEDDWTAWKLYYKSKIIAVTSQQLYYYTVNPNSIMAHLKEKPDLRYVNAYEERIEFFIRTRETDLEHCSRLQLCKSLLLTYPHKLLSGQDRNDIKERFDASWQELKHSPYIRAFYKVLFTSFYYLPLLTSVITARLR